MATMQQDGHHHHDIPVERGILECALLKAAPILGIGLLVSLLGFLVPASTDRLLLVTFHLAILVAVGIWTADRMVPFLNNPGWFAWGWKPIWRRFAMVVVLVVIPTGVIGLITLASSATLRLQPSLQFLQLLSSLDIVWAGAALMYGATLLKGRTAGRIAAAILGVLCVWSLFNYLDTVGFTADGGWLLDGDQLMRLVIPPDMVAATVALASAVAGIRKSDALNE